METSIIKNTRAAGIVQDLEGETTAALCALFSKKARSLAGYISRKRSQGTIPEIIDGVWPGEEEFNADLETFRQIHATLWKRSAKESLALNTAMLISGVPYSGINLNGFYTALCRVSPEQTES